MSSEGHEDFLSADPEIPGQRWCLLSFLSPENVLKKKDVYFFNEFVSKFEFNMKTKLVEEFLAKLTQNVNDSLETHAVEFEKQDLSGVAITCRNAKLRVDSVLTSLQEFVKKNTQEMTYDNVKNKYDDYMYSNRERLEEEYYKANDFHTTVRGLKIRGVYGSQDEANLRAKKLQKQDPVSNIYCAELGKWLPWDPEPSQIKEQEYAEDELNTLMKKYKENEEAREEFYRDKKNKNRERKVENIVGPSETNTAMFDQVGDLAIQRKMEQ